MSSVVISGDTSGTVTVAAPAVAGSNTLTLQAATATNSVNTLSTAITLTNQTAPDFTSIPSWVKKITVSFNGVSANSTGTPLVQIGSGSYTTSGYLGAGTTSSTSSTAGTNFTTGFGIQSAAAANIIHGVMTINLVDASTFKYTASFSGGLSNSVNNLISGGSVTLGGLLDRVRLYIDGTQFFDAGTVNILYEG